MSQKLLLISIIIAGVAIPMVMARDPNPRRALTKAVVVTVAFDLLYLLAVKFLYWRVL